MSELFVQRALKLLPETPRDLTHELGPRHGKMLRRVSVWVLGAAAKPASGRLHLPPTRQGQRKRQLLNHHLPPPVLTFDAPKCRCAHGGSARISHSHLLAAGSTQQSHNGYASSVDGWLGSGATQNPKGRMQPRDFGGVKHSQLHDVPPWGIKAIAGRSEGPQCPITPPSSQAFARHSDVHKQRSYGQRRSTHRRHPLRRAPQAASCP